MFFCLFVCLFACLFFKDTFSNFKDVSGSCYGGFFLAINSMETQRQREVKGKKEYLPPWSIRSSYFIKIKPWENRTLSYRVSKVLVFCFVLLFSLDCEYITVISLLQKKRYAGASKEIFPNSNKHLKPEVWEACFLALFQIPFLLWRVWTGNKDVSVHQKDCEHSCLIVQINGWKLPTVYSLKSENGDNRNCLV